MENGKVQPSKEKTNAVKKFPQPTTVKQMQSFYGLTGYFRKLIYSYSLIAKLSEKTQTFIFDPAHIEAFNRLKTLLVSELVLNIYRQGAETELHTDARMHGYGACLLQRLRQDNELHPIYCFIKKTTPAKEKYTIVMK